MDEGVQYFTKTGRGGFNHTKNQKRGFIYPSENGKRWFNSSTFFNKTRKRGFNPSTKLEKEDLILQQN